MYVIYKFHSQKTTNLRYLAKRPSKLLANARICNLEIQKHATIRCEIVIPVHVRVMELSWTHRCAGSRLCGCPGRRGRVCRVVYACFGATSEVDLLSKIQFRSRSVNRKYDPPTQWELGKLVSLMTVKISSSICSSSEVTRSVYLVHYCSHWHSFCSD
jgi:hypothetical protein